jgi:hypothetical protein
MDQKFREKRNGLEKIAEVRKQYSNKATKQSISQ